MTDSPTPLSERLLNTWSTLSPLPCGKWLFSRFLGFMIPYTGSIGSIVQQLEPGHAVVALRDRRKVRNHLNSVHAIALANVAELSTGLAVLSGMPPGFNGILIGLEITYEKKARGPLIAECQCDVPAFSERTETHVQTVIRDAQGDTVTTAQARWLIGPV
ncbi:MAG: DUF4442 domain-containing protein [Gammaproteobacteria bacterium]|nr:DUF4442 domain-containing protein [Gammaproteobacteria bacterium]